MNKGKIVHRLCYMIFNNLGENFKTSVHISLQHQSPWKEYTTLHQSLVSLPDI